MKTNHQKIKHHLDMHEKHSEKAKEHSVKAKNLMDGKHMDMKEDKKLIKKTVKKSCMK